MGPGERGRSPCGAPGRGRPALSFGAQIDLLLKEEHSASKVPSALASRRADLLGAAADAEAGTGGVDTNGSVRADETKPPLDDGDEGGPSASDDNAVGRDATLDPMMQVLGALAPRAAPPNATARAEPTVHPDARTPIDQLMARLVRRVAWSGNGRNGVARLELGAGELEGATLVIQADDGVVRVALDLPPGVDRAAWKARISERLAVRGLQVEAVEVG